MIPHRLFCGVFLFCMWCRVMKNPPTFSYLRQGIQKISNMLTRQGEKKISNMKTFAISFLCFPSKRRKNGKVQLKSLFAFASNAGYQKKNNPFVGLIFAFRDEDKRISQTDCTYRGYQKTITALTARHTYATYLFSVRCFPVDIVQRMLGTQQGQTPLQ